MKIDMYTVIVSLVVMLTPLSALAADLPPHAPLRILIVSDEVNPHGLSAAELTQPGDLSIAFGNPASGLNIDPAPDGLLEIATDDLNLATAALSVPFGDPSAYDVVVYFAHRAPNGAQSVQLQTDFDAAVSAFLTSGGGFVSFHHGSYRSPGKDGIMALIGGQATGSVPWDTVEGQNVINVAAGHFVTTNGVEYPATVNYQDAARGVAQADYPFFANIPDERYPNLDFLPSASDTELLFASNYAGATHVLGFTHRRPEWAGVVVAYQPGEYQPNALDDLDGNNFQILANAIVYAANQTVAVPALSAWAFSALAFGIALAGGRAVARGRSGHSETNAPREATRK